MTKYAADGRPYLDVASISVSGTVDGRDVATDGTKLDGIEALADVTDATNVNAAGATMNTDSDVKANTWVIDEDTMVSDLDTKVPTQQSVKAYVDAAGPGGGDNVTVNGAAITDCDLDDATPTAPAGDLNVKFQTSGASPANVSAYVDVSALEPLLTSVTQNADTSLVGNAWFLDDDSMTADDATKCASQQSIKAYVDASAGGGGSSMMGFSAAATTVSKGVTNYLGMSGGNASTTEANADFYCRVAGTFDDMEVYVSANATGASGNTVTARKNAASQSLTVSYGSGVTGNLNDLSNSFTVAVGDRVCFEVVNAGSGGGTKDLVVESISVRFTPS